MIDFRSTRLALTGLFLSLSAPAWAAEGGGEPGLPMLDVSTYPEQLFWLAVTFAFLYVMLAYVAVPRIQGTKDNRAKVIADEIEAARAAHLSAKSSLVTVEKALATARAEAMGHVNDMMAEVSEESSARQLAQEKEHMRKLNRAEAEIAVTREAAMNAVRAQAAQLANSIVAKIMGSGARVPQ